MVTIKHTRESIAELEQEREQFKQQRDELIEDIEKLRKIIKNREKIIKVVKDNKDALIGDSILMSDEIDMLEGQLYSMTKKRDEIKVKYTHLTEHIKDKALHNPSVSRYIDLVHLIDELERD